jgi:SAM-dependent methyltransferase
MTKPGYLLDNAAADAGQRFEALSAVFNPWTFQHVEALGIGPGWRCWEVGAGGPTVPSWLAERSGSAGAVVATDIDTSWVGGGDRAYRVLTADVAADEPPGDDFHLVHARLVLVHVPGRDEALRRMAASLRPGGWLVIEDFDMALNTRACLDVTSPAEERANRIRDAFSALLVDRGVDPMFGRSLVGRLRALGLVDVAAQAYLPVAVPAAARLEAANTRQVRGGLVAKGIPDADVDAHLASLEAGELDLATPPLVTAWGRKP